MSNLVWKNIRGIIGTTACSCLQLWLVLPAVNLIIRYRYFHLLTLLCFFDLGSNAEIPISSADSEDRTARANIAASFQVIIILAFILFKEKSNEVYITFFHITVVLLNKIYKITFAGHFLLFLFTPWIFHELKKNALCSELQYYI